MGYLIALGLFVAFCAALLNPYGRKLLLTIGMAMIAITVAFVVLAEMGEHMIDHNANRSSLMAPYEEQLTAH